MSYWKVLGGVAAGVGVVVALPVAGPVGAVTALGAAIAGAVGGMVGATASAIEENNNEEVLREAKRQHRVEENIKITKLVRALEKAEKRMVEVKDYFNLLIALFAVGIAVANCDGEISAEELEEIEEFVSGVAHENLPSHVVDSINQLKKNPPNFNTAMEFVEKVDRNSWNLFGDVIEIVSHADKRICDEEKAFKQAWRHYRAA